MKIRKMALADLPSIVPLADQLGYKCSHESLIERFSQFDQKGSALFIGEISNTVMAFMQIQENLTLMSGKRAELNAVVIDKQFRGKGYGKQMMKMAEEWVKGRGLPKLRLGSRSSRAETHEFYKKYGFTVEKTWVVFSKFVT